MKLRATVTLDFEADDIMAASKKIEALQKDLQPVEKQWGEMQMEVRERRGLQSKPRKS